MINDDAVADDEGLTAEQRADFAALLVRHVPIGNIRWLGTRVLGDADLLEILSKLPSDDALASPLIERMNAAGSVGLAISILKTEAASNGELMSGLNEILSGRRLSDLDGLQAIVKSPDEPFFDNNFFELSFPRAQRTVCAIGLAEGFNCLKGTGFLIAPDLVITNFHVVAAYLHIESDDAIAPKVTGDNIYFFFDYLSAPRPRVPPDKDRPHPSIVVKAVKDNWLVRARRTLDNEGKYPYATDAANKFDYAVIRLDRSIGNSLSRRSGGVMRGWLNLDSHVDYLGGSGTRIVVLQHPGGAQQLFDVGTYDKLDPSSTRIWYSVNAERGASGGPAIDKEGRLYALHNAAVHGPDGLPSKVNQGVRIDRIFADLQLVPGLTLIPPPNLGDPTYWSLSDNVREPRPIIGRQFFRDSVIRMMTPTGERVMVVTGSKGSGRRFSIDLLKRIVGGNVPVVRFTQTDLRTLTPGSFVKVLAKELMLPDINSLPEAKTTEPVARWLSMDLPTWLAQRLNISQIQNPSRYPAWIVIDAVADNGERLLWADNLPDLVAGLVGVHDVGQAVVDLPQLRWLLLGSTLNILPPLGMNRIVDDLSSAVNTNYADDFANCLSLAWRSVEATAPMAPELLSAIGRAFVTDALDHREIVPAYLAAYVRRFIEGAGGYR